MEGGGPWVVRRRTDQSVQAEGKYRQRFGDWKGQMPLIHYREPHVPERVGFIRRLLEKTQC